MDKHAPSALVEGILTELDQVIAWFCEDQALTARDDMIGDAISKAVKKALKEGPWGCA